MGGRHAPVPHHVSGGRSREAFAQRVRAVTKRISPRTAAAQRPVRQCTPFVVPHPRLVVREEDLADQVARRLRTPVFSKMRWEPDMERVAAVAEAYGCALLE